MKKWFFGLLLVVLSPGLFAQAVTVKKNSPDIYYVKNGDNLWNIANVFLQDPWLWPEIWHINPQIDNPHLIFPGDKLALVTVIDKKTGEKAKKVTVVDRAPQSVKLSPGMQKLTPQVRVATLDSAIPAIPLEKISAFLSKSRVVNVGELELAPYVIAGEGKRIVTGAGDKVYARGDFSDEERIYGIYRAGEIYKDPVTKEILGMQALDIGGGRVIEQNDDIVTMIVNRVSQEVLINDRLLPLEQKKVTATFIPRAPAEDVKGVILSVENGVTQVGAMSVVGINLGEREGVVAGNILAISQAGEVVKDRNRNQVVQLPDVRAGMLIIFRTFEKMSFALVVSADKPLRVGDKVANP